MSWRVWLLMLATLAVFAAAWRRCSHRLLVGDFPIVERSSRGLALATLPHVAALVAPSARVRRQANRGTRQGLSRALRQSRGWAWCPAPRCPQRYGSTPQPWRAQAPTARDGCESPEVARPHLRSASRLWAGWHPLRCRMPGMQATARAHRRPARRYQGGERAVLCALVGRSYFRQKVPQRGPRYQSLGFPVPFSDDRVAQGREDFDDHEPRKSVTQSVFPSLVAIISRCKCA